MLTVVEIVVAAFQWNLKLNSDTMCRCFSDGFRYGH